MGVLQNFKVNYSLFLCLYIFFASVAGDGVSNNSTIAARQRELISQVRTQVSGLDDILSTDQSLQRYLKLTNYNVQTAASKIKQTAEWRRSKNIDNLILDDVSLLSVTLPYECTGKTADGNPVFYIPLGKWNFRKVQRDRQNARLQNYLTQLFEFNLRTAAKSVNPRTQEPVKSSVFIIDLQGLSIRQLLSGWGRSARAVYQALRTYEAHYPNTVKSWYVIRAPRNFRMMWFFLKRFVPADVVSTVKIYSRWSIRWRSELKSAIPKESLPKELYL
ncbi:unnamed protein product [Allacma fusca]|uniref:CRAL-TRIO domain-containing protein n=1 Tax=Allacma fusca TaxID=39272 RepID=A0A8J2PJM0_9HEXA|nr:unnamed protein product [Allacma fusca]